MRDQKSCPEEEDEETKAMPICLAELSAWMPVVVKLISYEWLVYRQVGVAVVKPTVAPQTGQCEDEIGLEAFLD
jgi:hypothetical protein